MKKIIIHHSAEIELWQAVEYYESKKAGLGLEFEKEVSSALAKIQSAPHRWPKKKPRHKIIFVEEIPLFAFLH